MKNIAKSLEAYSRVYCLKNSENAIVASIDERGYICIITENSHIYCVNKYGQLNNRGPSIILLI